MGTSNSTILPATSGPRLSRSTASTTSASRPGVPPEPPRPSIGKAIGCGAVTQACSRPRRHTGTCTGSKRTCAPGIARRAASAQITARSRPGLPASRCPMSSQSGVSRRIAVGSARPASIKARSGPTAAAPMGARPTAGMATSGADPSGAAAGSGGDSGGSASRGCRAQAAIPRTAQHSAARPSTARPRTRRPPPWPDRSPTQHSCSAPTSHPSAPRRAGISSASAARPRPRGGGSG